MLPVCSSAAPGELNLAQKAGKGSQHPAFQAARCLEVGRPCCCGSLAGQSDGFARRKKQGSDTGLQVSVCLGQGGHTDVGDLQAAAKDYFLNGAIMTYDSRF